MNSNKNSNHPISRRDFIATAATATAASTFTARSYAQIIGANSRLNFAIIGLNPAPTRIFLPQGQR